MMLLLLSRLFWMILLIHPLKQVYRHADLAAAVLLKARLQTPRIALHQNARQIVEELRSAQKLRHEHKSSRLRALASLGTHLRSTGSGVVSCSGDHQVLRMILPKVSHYLLKDMLLLLHRR